MKLDLSSFEVRTQPEGKSKRKNTKSVIDPYIKDYVLKGISNWLARDLSKEVSMDTIYNDYCNYKMENRVEDNVLDTGHFAKKFREKIRNNGGTVTTLNRRTDSSTKKTLTWVKVDISAIQNDKDEYIVEVTTGVDEHDDDSTY